MSGVKSWPTRGPHPEKATEKSRKEPKQEGRRGRVDAWAVSAPVSSSSGPGFDHANEKSGLLKKKNQSSQEYTLLDFAQEFADRDNEGLDAEDRREAITESEEAQREEIEDLFDGE